MKKLFKKCKDACKCVLKAAGTVIKRLAIVFECGCFCLGALAIAKAVETKTNVFDVVC